jgi:hypothetical protein
VLLLGDVPCYPEFLLGGQQLLSWPATCPCFFWEGHGQQSSLSSKFVSCIDKSSHPQGGLLVVVVGLYPCYLSPCCCSIADMLCCCSVIDVVLKEEHK